MDRRSFIVTSFFAALAPGCTPGDEILIEDSGPINVRSGDFDFTVHVGGPGNVWSPTKPYVSYYMDLVCYPQQTCTSLPDYVAMLYEFTSEGELAIRGKTDSDGGLPNGVTYEKRVSTGQWTTLSPPYAATLNVPYLDGHGNSVTDTMFRVRHKIAGAPWTLVNGRWESPSTWIWFPQPNGNPFTPEYDLAVTLDACGNGDLDSGEQCDDGNSADSDTCTNTCEAAVCGDGIVQVGIEDCDDGNDLGDDGCEACQLQVSQRSLFVAQQDGSSRKLLHNLDGIWAEAPVPPVSTTATITNDGEYVYLMSSTNDHTIHRFSPGGLAGQGSWSVAPVPGPAAAATNEGGAALGDMFVWFKDGFYFLNHYQKVINGSVTRKTELWVYRFDDEVWNKVFAANDNTFGYYGFRGVGWWDRSSERLFVRYFDHGFAVLDTRADSPAVDTFIDWNGPDGLVDGNDGGAFSAGSLYRWNHDTFKRFLPDGSSGAVTTTPNGWATAWNPSYPNGNSQIGSGVADTDHADGSIYILGASCLLKRFVPGADPSSGTLTTLSTGVTYQCNAPTLTVMRPEFDH